MAPLSASAAISAVLHLYTGVSPSLAMALTAAATVPAITVAIVWAVIAILRERSNAQIRSAVIEGKIQAKDAALLLGHDVRVSAALRSTAELKSVCEDLQRSVRKMKS
jgi:hypothetical protein